MYGCGGVLLPKWIEQVIVTQCHPYMGWNVTWEEAGAAHECHTAGGGLSAVLPLQCPGMQADLNAALSITIA